MSWRRYYFLVSTIFFRAEGYTPLQAGDNLADDTFRTILAKENNWISSAFLLDSILHGKRKEK